MKVIVHISPENIWNLEKIGREGWASDGWGQDFQFCLTEAIKEFIKKYGDRLNEAV